MMRVVVLDDNVEFLHGFSRLLTAEFQNRGVKAKFSFFSRAESFLNYLETHNGADLLFVDILLPDHHGVRLAEILQTRFLEARVVFISGVAATAAEIFDARPSYFLLKPIDPERLHAAVSAALQEQPQSFLTLRQKGQILRIPKSTIEYVESSGRTLTFHGLDQTYTASGRLGEITALLGEEFLRCHKSYTANLKLVHQIDKMELVFFSGRRIPIARPRQNEVKEKFFRYVTNGTSGIGAMKL